MRRYRHQNLALDLNPHFQTDVDGHLVFWCPVNGATTEGTKFPRSELREMLEPENSKVKWPMHGTHILGRTLPGHAGSQ